MRKVKIMISASATLPLVIIFERYWDQESKKIQKDLVPELSEEGYDTICFEAPQDLTEEEILSLHREGLEIHSEANSKANEYIQRAGFKDIQLCELGFNTLAELMRLHVSSKRYLEVAEWIKGLSGSILLKDIFNDVKKRHFSIKGVDIDATDFGEMMSHDLSQRMRVIDQKEEVRNSTIFENLVRLRKSGRNIIFFCGALHAESLINQFKEKNMQNQVLYYFPHSNKNYEDGVDDVKKYHSNETLKNHTFCLIDDRSRNLLKERIIREIKSNNTDYKEEIFDGNSQSRHLSDFFKMGFKAYVRPGYYVDALLEICNVNDCENVVRKLQQVNLATSYTSMNGRNYLVVRDINTKEVADNIRLLN